MKWISYWLKFKFLSIRLLFFYYGLYLVSLFLTLIGVLFTKYSYFTLGYIITVIIYIIAMYVTFKEDLNKNEKNIK